MKTATWPEGFVKGVFTETALQDCNANQTLDVCESVAQSDFDGSATINLVDHQYFEECFAGPMAGPQPPDARCRSICLQAFDADSDGDIDLYDHAAFARAFAP